VRYFIHYGEPLTIDPAVLESIDVRAREVERVRDAVREQIHRGLEARRDFPDRDRGLGGNSSGGRP
jgi:hypothetical protein